MSDLWQQSDLGPQVQILIVDGYIRKFQKESKVFIIVPQEIYPIILIFYDIYHAPNAKWTFDVITDGFDDYICNEGKVFRIKDHLYVLQAGTCVTVTSSIGYNSGLHKFEILFIGHPNLNAFSIVSGQIHKSSKWITSHKEKHYYYMSSYGHIYTDNDKRVRDAQPWKDGDTIAMILDCEEWTLTYVINHTSSYKIDIDKHKTYRPCITAVHKDNTFMIL
eukprot:620702_1